MHGCASGPVLLVNAEVDSMGGVIDGVGISSTPSPQQSSDLEKTQAELRQTFTAAEKFRRELEFLQKGGDPLDLKTGSAATVSVQSTSLTDQLPEQFVTSEAKGSFAVTASPHGDSVESSGRLGAASLCEPNSADNLMLFDGDNEFREADKRALHPRTNNTLSKHYFQLDAGQSAKESGDSVADEQPKKAYKRRIRSRPNRDGARSSTTDAAPSRVGQSYFPSRHTSRDAKGSLHDADNQDRNCLSNSNSKPQSPNARVALKNVASNSYLDTELDGGHALESTIGLAHCPSSAVSDANASKNPQGNLFDRSSKSDTQETPVAMASGEPESVGGVEHGNVAGSEHPPCADVDADAPKAENLAFLGQTNGFGSPEGEKKGIVNDGQNSGVALPTKGLDSESSCTQTSQSLDCNNGNELPTSVGNGNSNGTVEELASKELQCMEGNALATEKDDNIVTTANDSSNLCHPSCNENGSKFKEEEDLKGSESALQNDLKNPVSTKGVELDDRSASETERKPGNTLGSNYTSHDENACAGRVHSSNDTSFLESTLSVKNPIDVAEQNACSQNDSKLATKEHEDSILEEARIIEAKRKRIAELSVGTLPLENRRKSHWDFVLEEMSWLANDFAQERLWKLAAAAQISRRAAFTSWVRFRQQCSLQKQKVVAHTLAVAVMEFWNRIQVKCKGLELQCPKKDSALGLQGYALRFLEYNSSLALCSGAQAPVTPERISDMGIMDISWEDNLTEVWTSTCSVTHRIKPSRYSCLFLANKTTGTQTQCLKQCKMFAAYVRQAVYENLFYAVPPGAIEAYRKSIESHLLQCERTGSSMQEEVDTCGYDAVADNAFEEEEGETSTYYLPGAFEGSKQSKFAQKRKKSFKYGARSYEMGADLSFMPSAERNIGPQPSVLSGKRPANSLNVSIPTKRVRTASRQRVLSPFNVGPSGCVQAPNRTDASSGDTNSFQDEQSTLQGGSQIPNNLEAESVGDYEKQLQFDSTEVSNRPKKKKKAKHPGSAFEHRWQLDSNFQNDQKDHSKRRLDTHQFDSNGSSGLFGQHIMKKPKMMRQSLDNSFDNLTPLAGSIPSPVASQMSNMSNSNKFMKFLVRDRGRKAKALKTPTGQPGSGSPWSLFEDQALVVLVHDMGPNWELISDAINSTLQFKCIFRKPKECKERHKILMDRNTGDGADSAEDSGSSQPYPSTLPGIPEGSARQLFQRLQGPMEEDTLKSHFEKIIMIGQKQHYKRTQNENQDPKQLQQPHASHTLALSQVCPNNLDGGPVLTPLDLCDATASSPDVLPVGYQGPHAGGLPIPNQGTVAPMLPGSNSASSVPGSSNVVLGNNFSSASAPLNPSVREGRYGVARTNSLSIEDQQRMQQYNQMLSARNMQQSSLPVPGSHVGADRGVRILPGGNAMGVVCGMNRSMAMARPGFQGIASSSMLNSGSMLSSGMTMPSPANIHSGAGPGQGNSILRSRDAMHMIRPSQNSEHQRQIMPPDLQMQQGSQGGSSQGVPTFASGMSSSFPNQTVQPPVQSYPLHHQQQAHPISPQQSSHVLGSNSHHQHHLQGPTNHAPNSQHPAYGMRFVKERQLQQQRLLQQQQFATSTAMMPHAQPQHSQLSVSSPQNSTQIQSQSSSPPVSLSPMGTPAMTPVAQHPQKHAVSASHGLVRNPQTGGNQLVKQQRQRQSQQLQQSGRQHPQQRQQAQSQQQPKLMKGNGRGTMMMHQNLPIDASLLNGFSGGQSTAEKGEQQVMHHLMQSGQGNLYSGSSGLSSVVQGASKQSTQSSLSQSQQQKAYSSQTQSASSKQLQQQKPAHSSDNSNNPNHTPSLVASSGPPLIVASSNHHQPQPQPHQKLVNQNQAMTAQRMVQQNRQVSSSDLPTSKLQAREAAEAGQPPVLLNNSSQTSTTIPVPQAPCSDATSSEAPVVSSAGAPHWKTSDQIYDSSAAMADNGTQFGKSSVRMSPPQTSAETGSEPSGAAVNQGIIHRQSSSDSLPNPVGHDIGVQWQQPSS